MNLASNEILLKIISGNESSFESLYRYYYPRLDYFAQQYLLDSEASKNIIQYVFTELWDKKHSLRADTNLNMWLFTFTKNKSLKTISHMKSQQNYGNFIKMKELEVNHKSLADFDTSNIISEELQAQLQTIPDRKRD